MSYFVKWKPKPLNFISKLPKNIALRIWDKLDKLKENPFRYLKHFETEEIYKFRIGDYRALISIDFEKKTLIIEVLDKRGRVYKGK